MRSPLSRYHEMLESSPRTPEQRAALQREYERQRYRDLERVRREIARRKALGLW